jgi:hypothetical protein
MWFLTTIQQNIALYHGNFTRPNSMVMGICLHADLGGTWIMAPFHKKTSAGFADIHLNFALGLQTFDFI